jgi:hypothetical protein
MCFISATCLDITIGHHRTLQIVYYKRSYINKYCHIENEISISQCLYQFVINPYPVNVENMVSSYNA